LDDFNNLILAKDIKNYDHINHFDLRSFIESEIDEESEEKIEFLFRGQIFPPEKDGTSNGIWAIEVPNRDIVLDTFLYTSKFEYDEDVKILKGED
jgi:hypothetical protein